MVHAQVTTAQIEIVQAQVDGILPALHSVKQARIVPSQGGGWVHREFVVT